MTDVTLGESVRLVAPATRDGRRRLPALVVAVCCGALLAALGGALPPAHATSQTFCGTLVSSAHYPNTTCYSGGGSWSYASATYNGTGYIDELWAEVLQGPSHWYSIGHTTTFTNVCHYPIQANRQGDVGQWEASGASHTIDGRVDDSPNHTGCI